MPPRRSSRWLIAALLLGLSGAGVGGYLWSEQHARQELRATFVPTVPVLQDWPAEFRLRVEAQSRHARSGQDGTDLADLAALYHANGFLAEARRCYQGLEATGDATALTLYRHGLILANYGEAAPALARWEEARRLAPDYLPLLVRRGELLLKANAISEAATAFADVLARDSRNLYALLGAARCDVERGEWASARRHLETVTSLSDFRLGYDLIVTVYEKLGLAAEAAKIRARAKAQGTYRDLPDPWQESLQDVGYDPAQLALAATVQREAGERNLARQRLARALHLAPADAKLYFQRGLLDTDERKLTDAREAFQRCTELDPEFPDGWVHLWGVLSDLGLGAQAKAVFAEGLRRCPNSYGLNLMHARALKQNGQARAALPFFEKAIEVRPTEPDPYIDLGLTYLGLGETEKGLAEFRRALAVEPSHPLMLTALTVHAIETRNRPEAEEGLARCRAQPRVSSEEIQKLEHLFHDAFSAR